jgi:hypothetical protein
MPTSTLVLGAKRFRLKQRARAAVLEVLGPQWIYRNDLRAAAGVPAPLFAKVIRELEAKGVAQSRLEPVPLYLFNLWRPEGNAPREWVPRRRYRRTPTKGLW